MVTWILSSQRVGISGRRNLDGAGMDISRTVTRDLVQLAKSRTTDDFCADM